MKNWKPFFIENSKVPVVLSYFAPIDIWAITLFFLVFCKGNLQEIMNLGFVIYKKIK